MRWTRLLTVVGILALAVALVGCTKGSSGQGETGGAPASEENTALRTAIEEADITAEIVDLDLKKDKDASVLVLSIHTASYGTRAFVPDLASFTRELENVLVEQGTDVDVILIDVLSEDSPGTTIQIQRSDLQEFHREELPLDQYFLRWEYPTDGPVR